MATLRFGNGAVKLTMSDDFERIAKAAIGRIAPGAVEVLEPEIEEVYQGAVAEAPVRTGRFKAGLDRAVLLDPSFEKVRGTVWDDVPYARYVRFRRNRAGGLGGKSVFVELLRKPMRAKTKRVAELVAARAAAAIGGR